MPVVNLRYQAMLVYNKRDAFQNSTVVAVTALPSITGHSHPLLPVSVCSPGGVGRGTWGGFAGSICFLDALSFPSPPVFL